jgi:hypothetical protein
MVDDTPEVPRWLWITIVGGLAAVLLVAAGLVLALLLGWNDPRPGGQPDWQAPDLPRAVGAAAGSTAVELLDDPAGVREARRAGFILEGTASAASGPVFNGYGFVFGAQTESDYAVFALGSDGYYAVLHIAGNEDTELVPWQQFPHIRRGTQANRMRVECADMACDFYINDEYASTVSDASFGPGGFGLWVRSFDEQAVKVEFSSLAVWRVPASTR